MSPSGALTRFLQALNEIHEYHVTFGLIRDVAAEGAECIADATFLEVLKRHIASDRVAEFELSAWRVSVGKIFTQQLTLSDSVSPNNLMIVSLVAHFEAFLEDLRQERGYAEIKRTGRRGQRSPKDYSPGYRSLRSLYLGFVDIGGSGWCWNDLDELICKRDCIVHRRRVIGREYRESLTASPRLQAQTQWSSDYDWLIMRRMADEIWLTDAELRFHLRQLHEVAVYLDRACRRSAEPDRLNV